MRDVTYAITHRDDTDVAQYNYNSKYNKGINSSGNSTGVQGFNVTGSLSVSYKLGPVVSVYAAAGANHYAYKNSKFITSVDVNPGLTVNLTKAF